MLLFKINNAFMNGQFLRKISENPECEKVFAVIETTIFLLDVVDGYLTSNLKKK